MSAITYKEERRTRIANTSDACDKPLHINVKQISSHINRDENENISLDVNSNKQRRYTKKIASICLIVINGTTLKQVDS